MLYLKRKNNRLAFVEGELNMIKKKSLKLLVSLIEGIKKIVYKKVKLPKDVDVVENINYNNDNLESHLLDIAYPLKNSKKLPVIINVHGGAFEINNKEGLYKNYGMNLARYGFAVITMNYRPSSEAVFPAQIEDIFKVFKFIEDNHEKYLFDKNNVFLVGDSAGAYLVAIVAAIITSKELKKVYNQSTRLKIKALGLNCGLYDFDTWQQKEIKFPIKKAVMTELFGNKNYKQLEIYKYTSVLRYINKNYYPCYVMDVEKLSFFLEAQRLIEKLKNNNIKYKKRIYSKENKLFRDFHLRPRYKESKKVMKEMIGFFRKYI